MADQRLEHGPQRNWGRNSALEHPSSGFGKRRLRLRQSEEVSVGEQEGGGRIPAAWIGLGKRALIDDVVRDGTTESTDCRIEILAEKVGVHAAVSGQKHELRGACRRRLAAARGWLRAATREHSDQEGDADADNAANRAHVTMMVATREPR